MDFNDTAEQAEFRAEVRDWLRSNAKPLVGRPTVSRRLDATEGLAIAKDWQLEKAAAGYACRHFPKEYGGQGRPVLESVIYEQEEDHFDVPSGFFEIGLGMCAPVLMQYATEEQKQRFVPPILRAEEQWCTGYSEPGAGSDLASLQCRAERDGDHYVINGQKVWTSLAQWAQWMILLVRTDFSSGAKHKGITCLLVPMDTPGLSVKPIRTMNGESPFAEVFFDNARVPVANRLGEEGQGWDVTKTALAHERSSIAEVTGLTHDLDDLKRLAKECRIEGRPAIESPHIRKRLAHLECTIEAMRLNGLRFLTRQLRGEPVGAETSVNKLLRAEAEVEIGKLACDIEGSYGQLVKGSPDAVERGKWQRHMVSWPAYVIGGGTPNIQKNVIAERILGLPHDV
jgi:acyl-CoA dehydrogenase